MVSLDHAFPLSGAIVCRSETRFRAVSWVLPRNLQHGWHHLQVLSLVYRSLRSLLGLLAVLVRSDLSKDAELLVLRHENQVQRRQLSAATCSRCGPGTS